VNQGDKVRAIFKNNLKETTGVHFHGVEFDDFFQDGVVFVTQKPIVPGEEYTYEFTANNAGSLMYHSHHNATDQVGRGLLGAFIVDPPQPQTDYDREYLWISNDTPRRASRSTATAFRRPSRCSRRRVSASCSGS
jgi:FtsP/CotA-like multicopper oxidase with cupredoxin domain